ncbi:MAG: Nramp family divalent metal transporter [Coxiellaceae bacterium]|nr:MAG: Nramp family divalent metal transporter [Coxiellaceae bacterium]
MEPKKNLETASETLSTNVNTRLDTPLSPEFIKKSSLWKRGFLVGPGILVAVGYIDPGNWATDLAGGSYAGYTLLSVVLVSCLLAMFLQIMSARLGIATGKDLAENTREAWPRYAWLIWISAELAIIATDLAEVIGSAIALKLLFSVPITMGVLLTAFDVFLILALDKRGSHLLERIVASLLFIVACGFVYQLLLARPALGEVLHGFVPSTDLILDPKLLYLAIGIVGATIMPHNLYLHSNLVTQHLSNENKSKAATLATINTIISLSGAMLLNSALIILAGSVFHVPGHIEIAEITEAHRLLAPLLGSVAAPIVFAVMLLACGQSATITGTLAGQVVMSGFIRLRMRLWIRRLITRSMAIIPAILVILYCGEHALTELIVSSQVFLSLQLPIAMISVLILTSQVHRMGLLVNRFWMKQLGWISALIIILANAVLITQIILK